MNKRLILFITLFILFFSACGKKEFPIIYEELSDIDTIGIARNDHTYNTFNNDFFTITWDNHFMPVRPDAPPPNESNIAQVLNDRFNVIMTSATQPRGDMKKIQDAQMENGTLPDIFKPITDLRALIDSGAVRDIPWEMVEVYAPKYAAFLRNANTLSVDSYNSMGNGKNYFLFGLEEPLQALNLYSIYRLDWLEEMGITPHGEVTKLNEQLYFTETAFNMNEWIEIMIKISNKGDGRFGFALNFPSWERNVGSLLGMWGLNVNIIQDDEGKAIIPYTSNGFRAFLELMELMNDMNVIQVTQHGLGGFSRSVCWWSDTSNAMFNDSFLNNISQILKDYPSIKLLITPPEIGPTGMQCAPSEGAFSSNANITYLYMIGSHVSDEKLVKILEIFDEISYCPDLNVMTKYGIEGEDFYWKGEPYYSPVMLSYKKTITPHYSTPIQLMDMQVSMYITSHPWKYISSPQAHELRLSRGCLSKLTRTIPCGGN